MKFCLKKLILATLAASTASAWALDAQQVFERVSPSVVVIKAGDALGSGVVYAVDNSGLTPSSTILTNCHVVKGQSQVTVERLGKKATGIVKVCDADRDMAIITLGGALPTLHVRNTALRVGEPAFAVGAPQGLELSISQGIVSQLRPTPLGKDPMIQTTAAISQGSSGGGLFDSDGRLIGLTTLYYKQGQSLNFAVPISFVAVLKHATGKPPAASPRPQPSTAAPRNPTCGWSFLSESTAYGSYKAYIDYCKIMGTGRYRFAWVLNDLAQPQRDERGYVYTSDANKWVFDCQLSRSAVTAEYHYQGKMGQGAVMGSRSYSENEWQFIDSPPNSMAAFQLETVCK